LINGYILGINNDGCEDVDECEEGKDQCNYALAPNGLVSLETCQNIIGGYVCIPWNVSTCVGPTAKASVCAAPPCGSATPLADRNEVKGLLGNGKVELYADESTLGDSPIEGYFWTLVSAPAGSNPRLQSTLTQTAFVSELSKKGEYVFQVQVMDTCGKSSTDTVTVTKVVDEPTRELVGVAPGSSTGGGFIRVPGATLSPVIASGPGFPTTSAPLGAGGGGPGLPGGPGSSPDQPWTKPRTRAPNVLSAGSSYTIARLLVAVSLFLSVTIPAL